MLFGNENKKNNYNSGFGLRIGVRWLPQPVQSHPSRPGHQTTIDPRKPSLPISSHPPPPPPYKHFVRWNVLFYPAIDIEEERGIRARGDAKVCPGTGGKEGEQMGVPLSPSSRDRCLFALADFFPENIVISIYKFMQTPLHMNIE